MISKWDELRYFTPSERWGNPDKMDRDFLVKLDGFRHAVGLSFQVLEGYATTGHAPKSLHYEGRAVDGRFLRDGKAVEMDELVYLSFLSPFTGIGLYSWGASGPFVHFDDRTLANGRKAVWVSHKQNVYEPFTKDSLKSLLS